MAHIFKKTTPEQKGIIVISHQEAYRAFESHGDIIQKIKDDLNLNADSTVLLFSTEGDTDPDVYRDIVWS